ncbi:MAG: beta strand repeat-containing protein, partial [Gemmatimonadaceae bacterium]
MRPSFRSIGTLLSAVALATCSDAPTVASAKRAASSKGLIAFSASFSKEAAAVYAQRASNAALGFDHVHIVLIRPPSEIVVDTIVTFTPDSPPQTFELTVPVRETNEAFNGELDYTNNGVVVYQATAKVVSHPADEPAQPQDFVVVYVGPGATATKLTVTPKTVTIVAPGSASFTAVATDANNAAVAGVPVTWASSDPSVASIDAQTGALATTGKRGTVTVTASAPTTSGVISDNASVTVTLPPASITLVSGGGQTGKAGTALAAPAVVRVLATDGQGVEGVTVNFAPPTGGKVGASSVTTDATGTASTSLTLGGTAGPQSFAAVAGAFSVSISATATPGDPAIIVAVSGGGQQDTVKHPLALPFVVKVTDAFNNGVGGVTVSWVRSAGTGILGGPSSVTSSDGTASMSYTLGATPGAETVSASVSGVATAATFSATALSAGPVAIASVSGGGQVGRIGQPLGAAFVVRVTDDVGQGVGGVTVVWSAINGTISPSTITDAQGMTSNTLTLGNTVGAASVVATIKTAATTKSVTFSATVQVGVVARLAFRAPPANGLPGVVLAPVQIELRDAAGNLTAAANAVTIALGANPGDATLGGTLTRTSSAGVATFDDLAIGAVANGYTLVASSAGVPSVTSSTFNIGGTPITSIGFVDSDGIPVSSPSITVTAGTNPANLPFIKVNGPNNVGVPNVTVGLVAARNGTTTFTGTATTDGQGEINLAGVGLTAQNLQIANNYSLAATLAGVPGSPLVLTVTVVPAAAAKYVLSAPTLTPTAGSPVVITAAYADQFDNVIATPQPRTVNWSVTGAGTVAPPSSATSQSGQATTTYTASATPGQGGTVTATDAGTPAITGQIALTATTGAATQLGISVAPPSAIPDRVALGNITVQVRDASFSPVAVAGVSVTASLNGAPAGGVIAGTATASTDATGQAAFANLSLQGPTGVYTLRFSAAGLTAAQVNVTVTAGTATTMTKLSGDAQVGVAGLPLAAGLRIQLRDADGNPAASPVTTINFSTTNGSVTPAAGTDGAGQATATWTLPATAGPVTMTASATISGVPVSVVFNATSVVVAGMRFVGTPPTSAQNGVTLGPIVVQLVDASLNPVNAAGIAVNVGIIADPSCSLCSDIGLPEFGGTTTVLTDATGRATFSDLSLFGQSQIDDLTFDATVGSVALPELVTPAITFTGAAQGTSITATGPRVFSVVFGQSFPSYPIAHVTDGAGAPVAGVVVNFFATGNGCDTGDGLVPVTTNASGDAALTPALLPFAAASPAGCLVFAESDGIDDIETWSLIARPSGTVAWTGITSSDWLDASNWIPAQPANTDVVFVPSEVWNTAQLSTGTVVGGVSMDGGFGGIIDVADSPLTINGDYLGSTLGEIVTSGGNGTVTLSKAGAGAWSGAVFVPLTIGTPGCAGGTSYTLGGSVNAASLTVNCPVDVNDVFLLVQGDLVVQNSGQIILNQPGSLVQANNMTFQGVSTVGFMTNGHVDLLGNLTALSTMSSTPFAPSGNTSFEVSGPGAHTVSWGSNVVPSLGIVSIDAGTGPVTFTSSNLIPVSGTLFTGSTGLTIPAGTAMTVSGAATFFNNSVSSILGTLSLGANSVFSPSSNVGGTGILTVTLPCFKSPNAAVLVGSGPAPFNG